MFYISVYIYVVCILYRYILICVYGCVYICMCVYLYRRIYVSLTLDTYLYRYIYTIKYQLCIWPYFKLLTLSPHYNSLKPILFNRRGNWGTERLPCLGHTVWQWQSWDLNLLPLVCFSWHHAACLQARHVGDFGFRGTGCAQTLATVAPACQACAASPRGLHFRLPWRFSSMYPESLAVSVKPRLSFCFHLGQPHGTLPGGSGKARRLYGSMDFWRDSSVDLLSSLHVESGLLKILWIYLHGNLPTEECTVIQRNLLPIFFHFKVTLNQVWVNIYDFSWNVTDSWHGN